MADQAEQKMRWGRVIGWTVLSLLVLIAAAIGFLGFTSAGTAIVLRFVEPSLATGQKSIVITGAGPLLTGHLTVGRIALADEKGVYAEIDGLVLDWSPAKLLSMTADIKRLSADKVSVTRPPVSSSSNSSMPSLQDLPLKVNLEQLSVPEISLGAPFTGRPETLSATASAKADTQGLSGSATIKDLGSSDAVASLTVDYNEAAQSLAIDAKAEEPKGGVIAGLLGIPERPALSFAVKGNGPLTNWNGKATASVEGVPLVDLDAHVEKPASGPIALALKGGGAVDAILPPVMEPLFKGRTTVDLALSIDPAGAISVRRGKIATGTLSADVSGTISKKDANDFQARIVPVGESAIFSLPVAGEALGLDLKALTASVSGSANKADVALSLQLNKLTAEEGTFRDLSVEAKSDAFDLQAVSGQVQTRLSVGAAEFRNPSLDRLLKGPFAVTAPVSVSSDVVKAGFQLKGANLGGKGSLSYDMSSNGVEADFQLDAAPAALPEAVSARLSDRVALSGHLSMADGNVKVTDLAVSSQLVNAQGEAALADGKIEASLKGTLPDLSRLSDTAKGNGSFALTASGTPDAPQVNANLAVPKAILSGKELDNFTADINAALKDGSIGGNVKASGSIAGQAIDVAATLKQETGGTVIPDLEVKVGANRVTGALALNSSYLPQGKLAFNLPDLSLLGAMTGQPLKGSMQGDVNLQNRNGAISAKVDLTGDSVRYDTVDLSGLDIHLDYDKAALSGRVAAGSIVSGTNRLENPALTFSGQGGDTQFGLSGKYGGAPISAQGSLAMGKTPVLHLDSFGATVQGVPVKLASPTDIAVEGSAAQLDNLKITLGSGTVTVSGKAGADLDLKIAVDKLPANLANQFSPGLGAEGSISGTATVTGKASDPSANFSLSWPSASLAAIRSQGLPALNLQAKGSYGGGALTIDASGSGGGLSANANGKVQLKGSRSLALRLQGSAPLSLANAFVADQGIALNGKADFDISANGPLTDPRLTGSVKLGSAGAVLPRQNLNLSGIGGTITLDGQTARIPEFTAKVSGGGTVTVSGSIGVASGSGYPADLSIKLNRAVYSDGSMVNARLSGDLSLKGPLLGGAELGGTVRIAEAGITIPEKIPSSLAEINLKHKNAPPKVVQQTAALKEEAPNGANGSSAIRLSLDVVARNQIFVRGRGVDAELGGSLKITGNSAAPNVSGSFDLIRGRLEILGKRLDFTSGTIGFGGGLIPTLNLKASTSSQSLSITVTVSGPANDPEIAFSSSPARPQDEVLAQLIFDRPLSSLSAFQIAQLADAALQLAGGRSTSVFEKLRKGTGIDDLDVTTGSNGQAQVTAGKYINNRTYLQLQQGAGAGSSKAIINLDVGKGVKLRGEADSGGGSAAGIFYEKEY